MIGIAYDWISQKLLVELLLLVELCVGIVEVELEIMKPIS